MTQMGGSSIPAGAVPPMRLEHPEIGALALLARALAKVEGRPAQEALTRARIGEIGRRAEAVQLTAGVACQAIEVLSEMEKALVFARDSAEEARALRSLPGAAVDVLQAQVDLAVGAVDRLASEASFAGRRVFDGETLAAGAGAFTLPKLSSDRIGARAVSDMIAAQPADWRGGAVDFSQSVASAAGGGPNSLESWADGAVAVMAAGARQIDGMRTELMSFYRGAVLPAARDIAVGVANVIASDFTAENVGEAVRLLREAKGDFPGAAALRAAPGEGVLRLLD